MEKDFEKLAEEKQKIEENLKTLQDKCASEHGRKRRRRRRSRSRSRRRARGSRAKRSEDSSDDHSDGTSEPSSEVDRSSRKKLRGLILESLLECPGREKSLSVLTQRVKERFNEDNSVPQENK